MTTAEKIRDVTLPERDNGIISADYYGRNPIVLYYSENLQEVRIGILSQAGGAIHVNVQSERIFPSLLIIPRKYENMCIPKAMCRMCLNYCMH